MRGFAWAMVLVVSILAGEQLSAQSLAPKVTAEFPGASLKWIHAAEPEFQREKLDLDKYIVSILEGNESVVIGLSSFDSAKGARGSTGTYPGYEVEVRKRDFKVVRSNYIR